MTPDELDAETRRVRQLDSKAFGPPILMVRSQAGR